MPYIETLKVLQTGNTATGIFETMTLLLNLSKDTHRVSFIYDLIDTRLSVGDSLELASPTSGKPRKKRWWEQGSEQKKEAGQLRLPFSLYESAKIIHASYDSSLRQMKLKLRFVNVAGVEKTITFYNDGHASLDGDGLKAIRVHKVIRRRVEPTGEDAPDTSPFFDYTPPTPISSSGQRYSPSWGECMELAERAMEHGIAVTASHKVYDDETGEWIGSEFRVVEMWYGDSPMRYISFERLDGRLIRHRINRSHIRFVDNRAPSGTECRNMLEVAAQNGMVVTPSGKVYERESGVFLGHSLQLTSAADPPLFDDSPDSTERISIRGEMIMANGERWGFQTYPSKVTHIEREVYTPAVWGERERRRENEMFASNYSPLYGAHSDWVNSVDGSFNIRGTQSNRVSGE